MLRPTIAVGGFKGEFDVTKLREKLLGVASKPFVSLVLRREQPTLEYGITFDGEDDELRMRVELLLADFHGADSCDSLLALLRELAEVVEIIFARGHETSDADLSNQHRPNQTLDVPSQIDDVYWLTVWGREFVEQVGRSRDLVEELPHGAVLVLLLTRPTAVDMLLPDGRRAQARALAHLRPERTEEDVYAVLMDRSRRLAPAEKRFPADVASLFDILVQETGKVNRRSETERLNALEVPPITEVRSEPLRAQGDPAEAAEEYDDLAEQLIALLGDQVPEIESFDPAIVPKVDYWMWRLELAEDAERSDVEESLVPALGAYIALVMVKKLGGTLVPRRKLDESQVVIGGRAFLPFLRARHALASRGAQITHSMTQFIAVAQRG